MPWWRDMPLLLALAAAPAAWGALAVWQGETVSLASLPLTDPLHYLMLVLFYPVIEEAAFRGLVQGELCKHDWGLQRLGPVSAANLLTSVLFVGLHLINHPLNWALLVFFPSLVFGYFRDREGMLTLPIMLHIYYNSGYFLIFTA